MTGPSRRRAAGALAVVLLGASALGYRTWASGGAMPGPRPAHTTDPVGENAACEACHQEIAAEWRGSQHRTAFTDAAFVEAHAVEPTVFCRGCHAPESPRPEDGEAKAHLGVGCVSCHLAGAAVLAVPRTGLSWAPHRVDRNQAFATAAACAGCHQFSFGDDERREAPLAMQRTRDEHVEWGGSKSCAGCHMPLTPGGHRSHAFASTRDDAAHRRAVRATAERSSSTSVRIVLSLDGVGHAYPTGDLFRRVAVEAEVVGDDFRSLARRERFLARHFEAGRDLEGRPIRVEVGDDRLKPGEERAVELDLGEAAAGRSITWSVALDRVQAVTDRQEAQADVAERVVLASGDLAP